MNYPLILVYLNHHPVSIPYATKIIQEQLTWKRVSSLDNFNVSGTSKYRSIRAKDNRNDFVTSTNCW